MQTLANVRLEGVEIAVLLGDETAFEEMVGLDPRFANSLAWGCSLPSQIGELPK